MPQGLAGYPPTFTALFRDGPGSPPLYGSFLMFACLLPILSPKEVAVFVPARQAYSHWASVGSRNSQPLGSVPSLRPSSVSLRQNLSASAKLTLPTGRSSSSGSSAVALPGSCPTTRFH